jgi:hypothetical protein
MAVNKIGIMLPDNRSLVDAAPLGPVAHAFLIARRTVTDPSHD